MTSLDQAAIFAADPIDPRIATMWHAINMSKDHAKDCQCEHCKERRVIRTAWDCEHKQTCLPIAESWPPEES